MASILHSTGGLTEHSKVHLVSHCLDGSEIIAKPIVSAEGVHQPCICPHCRRNISMKVAIQNPSTLLRPSRPPPVLTSKENGYVALMYGQAPAYFVGALVTGWSLQKNTTLPLSCRVLLCTDDVPNSFRSLLSSVWTVRSVNYINNASTWFYWDYHKSRFKQVFTKLRILKDFHGEFKKVILLDLDLLVRGETDSLFKLSAPAAMVRGQSTLRHGEIVPMDCFYNSHRQVIGINCGVMLVEPNSEVFEHMLEEVEDHLHPEHWPSHGPEQDYLSRYFNAFGCWTNMSCRYNYQCHLTQFGSLEWHTYNLPGHADVSIFHFSGRLVKPWALLLDLKIAHGFTYEELEKFIREMPQRANESLKDYLSSGKPTNRIEAPIESETALESHFCFGTGPAQKGSKRCYLDRYVHPSWTIADSECSIEWIRAFQEADGYLDGRVSTFLETIWRRESILRTEP